MKKLNDPTSKRLNVRRMVKFDGFDNGEKKVSKMERRKSEREYCKRRDRENVSERDNDILVNETKGNVGFPF